MLLTIALVLGKVALGRCCRQGGFLEIRVFSSLDGLENMCKVALTYIGGDGRYGLFDYLKMSGLEIVGGDNSAPFFESVAFERRARARARACAAGVRRSRCVRVGRIAGGNVCHAE